MRDILMARDRAIAQALIVAQRMLGADEVGWVRAEDDCLLRVEVAVTAAGAGLAGSRTFAHGTAIGRVIVTGEPVRAAYCPSQWIAPDHGAAVPYSSLLAAPLVVGDETIGALVFLSRAPHAFNSMDLGQAEQIASLVAGSIGLAQGRARAQATSEVDQLTGVASRGHGLAELARRVSACQRRDEMRLAVALLDVDGLKANNDVSYAVGDSMLRRVGELLLAGSRPHDTVARIGGDEFLLLFPGAALSAGRRRVLELQRKVDAESDAFRSHGEKGPRFGISVGLTGYRPNDQPSKILARVDMLMKRDKTARKGGRD